jgi:hypothetical protein
VKRRSTIDPTEVAAAGGLFMLMAVWVFALFMVTARPRSISDAIAHADRDLDRIDATIRSPGDPGAYPPGALCAVAPSLAAATFRQQVDEAAASKGATLSGLAVDPGPPGMGPPGLRTVSVRFAATGTYDKILGLLDAVSRVRPELFLDAVELKSNISSVALTVNGRFYCSIYARP